MKKHKPNAMKLQTKDDRMGTSKVKTPVKAVKAKGPTRPPRQASAVQPSVEPALGAGPKEWHDPESDLHTLKRAESIRSDGHRHGAAVAHAKEQIQHMRRIVGMKVSTRD